mmetsp:Transcript_5730/g.4092  ORF Transcript_5730/g.4092 Transcript_5730/m.4092 type:complete len:258 (+) Transcript_5730:69-842(+)
MFEAKLLEGNILKKIIDAIKDIVTEVNFDISPSGISLQAMDSSHVALVSLNLSMEGFETYRADTNQVIGVSIANLAKVMKLADPTDNITLQAEQDPSHLKIIFENTKTERKTEFMLNLISLDVDHLAIPETEHSSIVAINSGEFSKICKELYSLSENLTISTTEDSVQFSVESDAGSGSIRLGQNDSAVKEEQLKIEVSEGVNQQFAIRYLNMFNKAATLSTFTRLCLSSDQPLVVEYKIEELGMLKYYLAPKISDE